MARRFLVVLLMFCLIVSAVVTASAEQSAPTGSQAGPYASDSVNLQPAVAILGSPSDAIWNNDVQSKLLGTGSFSTVDVFNIASVTPSLAQLQAYGCVLVYSDAPGYADSITLGNNLADYVDGGGGVVVAVFANASIPFDGRFATDNYWVIAPSSQAQGTEEFLVPLIPGHPILAGVSSFSGGTSSYRTTTFDVVPGSERVADWTDGTPLVATRQIGPALRADLGMFPPSSDARDDFWRSNTDGAKLMANALLYTCGEAPPLWPVAYESMFDQASDLEAMRQFRDEVLADSSTGALYTKMLYKSSEEALAVLMDNPELMARARQLINANSDALAAVLAGDKGVVGNTAAIVSFLDAYAAASPPALSNLAKMVKKDLLIKQQAGELFFGFNLR